MIGDYYIFSGKLHGIDDQSSMLRAKDSTVVYEVFTWENNSAIFFLEHYDRLIKSIELKVLESDNVPSETELLLDVEKLASVNTFTKNNIRLDLVYSGSKLEYYLLYFVKPIFPTVIQHKDGVKVGLCFGEREDPNAKIANSEIREVANKKIISDDLFEVLLVDSNRLITEGSRSNVFFVEGNMIYTSKVEKVLNGITRQKVIEIANSIDVEVVEKDIRLDDISDYESAFLTSTSMIVLPILSIEDIKFSVKNDIVEKIYSSFLGL